MVFRHAGFFLSFSYLAVLFRFRVHEAPPHSENCSQGVAGHYIEDKSLNQPINIWIIKWLIIITDVLGRLELFWQIFSQRSSSISGTFWDLQCSRISSGNCLTRIRTLSGSHGSCEQFDHGPYLRVSQVFILVSLGSLAPNMQSQKLIR